jgi:hypothetical protein
MASYAYIYQYMSLQAQYIQYQYKNTNQYKTVRLNTSKHALVAVGLQYKPEIPIQTIQTCMSCDERLLAWPSPFLYMISIGLMGHESEICARKDDVGVG